MRFIALSLFIFSVFVACKNASGPEESLRDYIDYSVSKSAHKAGFVDRSTGPLLESLQQMGKEDFELYVQEMASVHKRRIRINNKNCQDTTCFITYTISYDGTNEGESIYRVDVRKIAELRQVNQEWKLATINNVKSHYEGSREITDEDFKRENDGLTPEEAAAKRL